MALHTLIKIAGVAGVVLIITSCGFGPSGPAVQYVEPIVSEIEIKVPPEPDPVWVSTVGQLCLTEPGEATITEVELVEASGVTVDTFGVDPGEVSFLLGNPGTLESLGVGTGKIITVQCGDDVTVDTAAVNVQLSRTHDDQPGVFDGVVIHWTTGDRSGTLETPLAMTLQV